MMNVWKINFLLALVLCINFSFEGSAFGGDVKVKKIEISGNERILDSTIQEYSGVEIPSSVGEEEINASVKKLFATGFFSNVDMKISGSTLIISVDERPMLHEIAFEGNSEIRDSNLRKAILSSPRATYSLSRVEKDIRIISEMYKKQGYYSVKINAQTIKLSHNKIDLVYEIKEGKKAKIGKIKFIGNKVFPSGELKKAIMSSEYVFYKFLSSTDKYDPNQLLMDQELLRMHYMNSGYADFKINSATAELSPTLDSFVITFSIDEGEVYSYDEISLDTSIKGLDTDELKSMIKPKAGAKFNLEEVKGTVAKLTDYLGGHGYAFAEIDYDFVKNSEKKTLSVLLSVNMGKRMYADKINIVNNTRTLDRVIRRELRIAEQDPFNTNKIERSRQRLLNLGYFKDVKFKKKRTGIDDKMDLDIEVEEVPTGSVNFSVGYNTSIGVMGGVSVSESNFLGKGQAVELGFQLAKKGSSVNFGFTEPKFLDKDLAAGFDIFYYSSDKSSESSYDSKNIGTTLRAGYSITEYLSHGVRYSLKREKVKTDSESSSSLIREDMGNKRLTSSVGHTLYYDKSEGNYLFMTKGYNLKFSQDLAGLGGDAHYLRNEAVANFYFPVYKEKVILSLTARAGRIDSISSKKLKLVDNFFVGEEYIRGFEPSGIGPRDEKSKDALGGKNYYAGTAEITFPLGLPEEFSMRGAAFMDFADLYSLDKGKALDDATIIGEKSSLRSSYGIGIIWNSPLGKIRVDYGIPMKKESFDKPQRMRLSFGTSF